MVSVLYTLSHYNYYAYVYFKISLSVRAYTTVPRAVLIPLVPMCAPVALATGLIWMVILAMVHTMNQHHTFI